MHSIMGDQSVVTTVTTTPYKMRQRVDARSLGFILRLTTYRNIDLFGGGDDRTIAPGVSKHPTKPD